METLDRGGTKSSRLVSLLRVLTELSLQTSGITVGSVYRQLAKVNIVVSHRTVTRDLEMLAEQGVVSYDVDGLIHVMWHFKPAHDSQPSIDVAPQRLISLTGSNHEREVFIDPTQVSSVITEGDRGFTKISMKDRRTHLVVGEASDVAAAINRERMRLEAAQSQAN